MAVSSLKGCWCKFSARVREYLDDVVDSHYRPSDIVQQLARSAATGHVVVDGTTTIVPSNKSNHHQSSNKQKRSNYHCKSNHNHHHTLPLPHHRQHHHHHNHHQHVVSSQQVANDDIIEYNQANINNPNDRINTSTTTTAATQLPSDYIKKKTSQGQIFFVALNGEKYWYDPSVPKELIDAPLDLDSLVGKLSTNWEIRHTNSGKTYYVNHLKKTTQFTDPRLVAYKDYLHRLLKYANKYGASPSETITSSSATTTTTATTIASPATTTTTTTAPLSPRAYQSKGTTTNDQLSGGGSQQLTTITTNTTNTTTTPVNQISTLQSNHSNNSNNNYNYYTSNDNDNIQQVNYSKINQKELFDKISILRQELLKQQVIAHPCRIDVNRKRIFEESFRVVSQLQSRDLKKRLLVKFKGEEGLDYGGVAREWFYLLSREILNPAHGLFQYTSDDIYNLQINPDSGIVYREHLSYLNFCGRIIGMAVFHGHFIEGHFTLPFYKMLLRNPISLGDIKFVDPELHRSLCWMLENDITDVIDTTFLVQHNAFGQLQELELKDGGKNITVTEENKDEYVSLYVNYRCRRGIESQMEALQKGFYELISSSLVENFDEAELELLIGGLSKINVDDWKRHTKLKNCTTETPLVGWFWDIVRSYGEDKRARLLQFVTGSPRVPIQGFKALQGVNSELRLFTIHLVKNACTDNLPKSHTCFNRIDLPAYETFDKLRDKLTQAIEETMGFAMQ